MLKAILSYSKKVPAEKTFSSHGYSLSLETELPEGMGQEKIQEKIHQTFELVKSAVEHELDLGKASPKVISGDVSPFGGPVKQMENSKASNRQTKYIMDLARENDISLSELNNQIKRLYNVSSVYDLSKSDASKLVDSLRKEHKKAA